MPNHVVRRYTLEQKHKEIIEHYLHSEITGTEAAKAFSMTRDNFKAMVTTIVRHLVTEGTLDISSELSSY